MLSRPYEYMIGKPQWRRIGSILILLTAAAMLTMLVQKWAENRRVSQADKEIQRASVEALDQIEDQFRDLQNDMIEEARTLARSPVIVRGLRDVSAGQEKGHNDIVRFMADYTLPDGGAVEIYTQEPRIIGWSGVTMPLDEAPGEAEFLHKLQVKIARDGPDHEDLAVWWPVMDGNAIRGAVRVLRAIERRVQIRNEFLKGYSISDEWAISTGLRVETAYVQDARTRGESSGSTIRRDTSVAPSNGRLLRGVDGKALMMVEVTPPTLSRLVSDSRRRYLDVVFLWITLVIMIVLFAAGKWCLKATSEEYPVRSSLGRFVIFGASVVAARYLFLVMDVPGRWQSGKAPLAPLFDPGHLASDFLGGIMKSTGDLFVTAIALVVLAMIFVRATEPVRKKAQHLFSVGTDENHPDLPGVRNRFFLRFGAALFVHGLITLGLVVLLSNVARHAVLDSTLNYFERAGLLPDPIVLIVFSALLIWTFAVVFFSARLLWVSLEFAGLVPTMIGSQRKKAGRSVLISTLSVALVYFLIDFQDQLEWIVALVFVTTSWLVALYSPLRSGRVSDWLQLRSVVPSVVLISMLLYPILNSGFAAKRRIAMRSAADSFQEDVDSRILFAIGQVLDKADRIQLSPPTYPAPPLNEAYYDSLARTLTHGELIASLGSHDVSITLFDAGGTPLGRYVESGRPRSRALTDASDEDVFELVHAMYSARGNTGRLIEKMTGRQDQDQFPYEGFVPIHHNDIRVGWLMVHARPEQNAPSSDQAFPRVLRPAGFYGNRSVGISIAEFQNGVLRRSFGQTFGRNILDAAVDAELNMTSVLWRVESMRDREYMTMYTRPSVGNETGITSDPVLGSRIRTIAVRQPAIGLFDHLYFLLRITMAGLFLGIPVYLIGIWWRYTNGLLPARRVRFRDKVLNAFFVAGFVTVTATGWMGLRVVTGENDRAVDSWLRQHLERVEAALLNDSASEELPYSVLERIDLDSLAARVGLDLNEYIGAEFEGSSRPQLVRERLISPRLPVEAYEALFLDGFRFVSVKQSLGGFEYTAGYRSLPDESGVPRYVLSLPTLPEQERIEEERARTVAYLFGALLLLVLVVMVTAALLANALARPIAGLRAGLQAVSEGRFERIGPVDSRDEIADLVDTFNTMQGQLEESRFLLARQERQLAWQEMARQVAHEIRNPLTPMKLAVQHLQKAFQSEANDRHEGRNAPTEKFATRFRRTTMTLVEQIDALANIAEEFSSFGRFPQQTRSELDLNEIVTAAVHLMRNESRVTIDLHLTEKPLIVLVDEEAVRRLLINLIKNAFQAIVDERQGHIFVDTGLETESSRDSSAVVRVTDNGTGIPEQLWGRIFVPSFSTKTSGTGLGLAIARKTIEDNNGEIGFETAEGEGSTFWIRIPCVSPSSAG